MPRYYACCLTTFKDPSYSQGRRKCVGRRMLTKLPSQYVRPPKCPHCGGRKWYIDRQIVKRHKRETCHCSGLHFPHRAGSRFCYSHPEVEQDHAGRYNFLTPEMATHGG